MAIPFEPLSVLRAGNELLLQQLRDGVGAPRQVRPSQGEDALHASERAVLELLLRQSIPPRLRHIS